MFFKNKRIDELENSITTLRNIINIHIENNTGIIKLLESMNKRIDIQQQMIGSLIKQIDIIADIVTEKVYIKSNKPNIIKTKDS